MPEPTLTFQINTGTEGAPTWTTIAAADQYTPTGTGSSDGDLKNITRPAVYGGFVVAPEFWVNAATDVQCGPYEPGDGEVANLTTDIFTTPPTNGNYFAIEVTVNAESQAGQLEAWDDANYNTVAKEALAGIGTYSDKSFLRAAQTKSGIGTGQTDAGVVPTGYGTQVANNRTWLIRGNAIGSRITFGSILAVGSQNRFLAHFGLPGSATAGGGSFQLAYRKFFT